MFCFVCFEYFILTISIPKPEQISKLWCIQAGEYYTIIKCINNGQCSHHGKILRFNNLDLLKKSVVKSHIHKRMYTVLFCVYQIQEGTKVKQQIGLIIIHKQYNRKRLESQAQEWWWVFLREYGRRLIPGCSSYHAY